jgi:hypothetical protein
MSVQFVNPLPAFNPPMMFQGYKSLFTRLSVKKIDHIIMWVKKEYWDSIAYWSRRGKFRNVKFEVNEFSEIRLMAALNIFDEIVLFIRYFPFVWDGMSKDSRDFLTKSYEFRKIINQKSR